MEFVVETHFAHKGRRTNTGNVSTWKSQERATFEASAEATRIANDLDAAVFVGLPDMLVVVPSEDLGADLDQCLRKALVVITVKGY